MSTVPPRILTRWALRRELADVALPALVAVALFAGVGLTSAASSPEKPRVIPPPALDAQPGQATSEVAVLAGGCFWGVQGVYQHVKGVLNAVSAYPSGTQTTPNYN